MMRDMDPPLVNEPESAGTLPDCPGESYKLSPCSNSQVFHHAPARLLVGQPAVACLQIVVQVGDAPRAGDGAGNCRMRKDVLEEELGPAGAVEISRPRRQR